MYASIPDKFLFIKTNKTAGTSIEIALCTCLANRDNQFFTPIAFEDEISRINLSGVSFSPKMKSMFSAGRKNTLFRQVKQHGAHLRGKIALLFAEPLDNLSSLYRLHQINARSFRASTGCYNHIPYRDCLSNCPALGEYWSCAFSRHPFKRFLSFVAWGTKEYFRDTEAWKIEDWRDLASSKIDQFCKRPIYFYSRDEISGKSVSEVLAFEKLKESTNIMCQKLDLPADSILNAMPNAKSAYASVIKKVSPDDIIDKEIRSKLLKAEKFVFEGLGYQDSLDNFMPERASISM